MEPPTSQKTLSLLSWHLLGKLDEVKHERFAWLLDARQRLLGGWENSRQQYREWRQQVDGAVEDLIAKGDTEGAEWLIATLLRDPTVYDPAEFEVTILTGHGKEVFNIKGSPDLPSISPPTPVTTMQSQTTTANASFLQDQASQVRSPMQSYLAHQAQEPRHEVYDDHVSKLLLLAEPVRIHFDDREITRLAYMSFDQARQRNLWICLTPSGLSFCVECPCPAMVTPSLSPNPNIIGPTYEPIPRNFHVDPLARNTALDHFQSVHYETFQGGVKDMVMKYGKRVSRDDEKDLDRWEVTEHNLFVKRWHDQLILEWGKLRAQYASRRTLIHQPALSSVERYVHESLVSTPLVSEPNSATAQKWAFFCSHPACVFPLLDGPFLGDLAIQHFRTHDLNLDFPDIYALFGFKVVRDVQETSHADTQAEEVAGPVAGERPDGRARNKLGKVELRKIYETSPYLTFTLEQLRHELTSRNIAFSPYLGTRKLIFQLLRDDYRQECI